MANIATGDFAIRGNVSEIQRFLDDAKKLGYFSFNLRGLDGLTIDKEIVDMDQYGRVKVCLPVDFRWQIDVSELEQLSMEYELDFWSLVIDKGMSFIHEVCVKDGRVVYDHQQNYVTWKGDF